MIIIYKTIIKEFNFNSNVFFTMDLKTEKEPLDFPAVLKNVLSSDTGKILDLQTRENTIISTLLAVFSKTIDYNNNNKENIEKVIPGFLEKLKTFAKHANIGVPKNNFQNLF